MQREISRNHTGDWDEQRERLSAYLDGELDEGEREALEQHLPACEQCQRTLDEYREVRALLRAMPMPAMPRSFAIPAEGSVPVPLAAAARASDGTARTHQQQQQQQGRRTQGGGLWSGLTQAVGSFVAAAGVILVLGSALTGTGGRMFSASSPVNGTAGSASASRPPNYDNTTTATGTKQGTPKAGNQDTGVPTPTATSTAKGGSTPGTARNVQAAPNYSGNVPVVPIGAGMVAGGAVLFVAGRASGSRRRRGRDRT